MKNCLWCGFEVTDPLQHAFCNTAHGSGAAAERAAIVADIRKWRDSVLNDEDGSKRAATIMDMLAWSIERSDHVKNDDTYTMSFAKDPNVLSVQRKIWEKK